MEDETDAQDISGLMLLEKLDYRTIPKIILTAYPSWSYAEKALGAALGGLQLAGMVDKAAGPKPLIEVVDRTFAQYIQVNWQLVIHWNNPRRLSFPHLVTLIEPEVAHESLSLRVNELEDLLRRLFYDSAQISISHLFTQGEGKIFLAIFAYSKRGAEKHYVVSCGQKQAILNENILFDEFVPEVTGGENLGKDKTVETMHFAATAYTLNGGNLEKIVTFSDLYHLNSIEVGLRLSFQDYP
jgi:hypothetical protein